MSNSRAVHAAKRPLGRNEQHPGANNPISELLQVEGLGVFLCPGCWFSL